MEILYEYTELNQTGNAVIALIVLLFFGIVAYVFCKLINKKYTSALIISIIAFAVSLGSIIIVKETCMQHILKVTMNDSVTLDQLTNKYDFIGNEGKIIILKEKGE